MPTQSRFLVILAFIGLLGAGLTSGCSDANKNSVFDPGTGHEAGWSSPSIHGASAKTAADGFESCRQCHGSGFSGGISATACFTCHGVNAPHAPAPWRGGTITHTTTNPGNAPVCALCHTNGSNSSLQPSPPAPAGTAPGCFNNTLCHAVPGHPAGWAAAGQHGASAKAQPAASAGFAYCETCHGSSFAGGSSGQSCFTCHGGSGPHPTSWIAGTYTHTTVDTGNAPVCSLCHANGANSPIAPPSPAAPAGTAPGCFNGTLCHAAAGHPAGWSAAGQHGASAKAQPATSAGFAYCETCHGPSFAGGSSGQSCFTCHGGSGPHPTSWIAGAYTHTNADTGNAPVCSLCHANGANSPIAPPTPAAPAGTAPGCFNNTLCHATPACGACHAIPPSGTAAPNVAGSHGVHTGLGSYIVCDTCHAGAGSGTALHQNSIADVAFSAAYNAKAATASFNASANTCSSVSCHGGQATPNWLTGTIDVNTQCTTCHAYGTSQYNSFNSGRHNLHVNGGLGITCAECHDTTKLASVHFSDLNTSAMTAAYQTIVSSRNYTGTGGATGRCNNFTCHGETHSNYQW